MFWTSSDIFSGFQSQSWQSYSYSLGGGVKLFQIRPMQLDV